MNVNISRECFGWLVCCLTWTKTFGRRFGATCRFLLTSMQLTSKLLKSEEAGCKTEADLVASRGRVLSLEGQVRYAQSCQDS